MPPTDPASSVVTDQPTRALGEAVIRIWSNLPQEVQDHHDKHTRTSDPLGNPREMKEPDSLGG
jgi:hypothetical protein